MNNEIKLLEQFFENITLSEIDKKIEEFSLNKNNYDEQEILSKLKDTLLFELPNTGGVRGLASTATSQDYQVGAQFFRVRKIEADKRIFILEDFWEAPAHSVNLGRFNKSSIPYLYSTVGDFKTPKEEVGVREKGETYLLMYYRLTEVLSLYEFIHDLDISKELTKETREKIQHINNFINVEILSQNDGAHLISSTLSNDIFNYSEIDGWCYTSTKNPKAINACVKVTSKNKLNLESAFICRVTGNNEDEFISSIAICNNKITVYNYDREPNKVKEMIGKMMSDNKEVAQQIKAMGNCPPPSKPEVFVNILKK